MSRRRRDGKKTGQRILDIAALVALMVLVVLGIGRALVGGDADIEHPRPHVPDATLRPIASEADVYRTHSEDLGMAPMADRDTAAHARTLAFFRMIREYPGAPPRIPHGLTEEEFRSSSCNNCHRRGGFVARFGDYARVTPHPELGQCLQCHVPRDTLVGLPLPPPNSESNCSQCHVDPGEELPVFAAHDWVTTAWPDTGQRAHPEAPLLIPHGSQLRSNCLACHAGPEAVMGIRTDHPERANCRQCHIPAATDDAGLPVDGGPPPDEPDGGPSPGGVR